MKQPTFSSLSFPIYTHKLPVVQMISTLCLQKWNYSNNCGGMDFGAGCPACRTEHFQLSDFKTAEDKSIEVGLLLDLIEIRPCQGLGSGVWQLCMCSEQYSI